MEPGLQQLETEPGFPMVVRVDVEENVELSAKFGIRAMPTLMLFENGGPVLTQVGALSQTQLRSFVTTQSIAKL
jgi:thioredoxin 1